jgi:hypothetical protein
MKHAMLSATVTLMALCVLRAQAPQAQPEVSPKILAFTKQIEPAKGDTELQKKLKERHNSAVRLLDERIKEYRKGLRDAGPVFEAARLVADAKLDLAATPDARRAVMEQTLEVARLVETRLQAQLDKGLGSRGDLERARYARLSVEVELLKARQKDQPAPK